MGFAEGTSVSVEKTRLELEARLKKEGADVINSTWTRDGSAAVSFRLRGRMLRFVVPMPKEKDVPGHARGNKVRTSNWLDGETRRRWRCLRLAIWSKLEVVATGISSFEEEFLANIVLPDDMTIYERLQLLKDVNGTRLLGPAEGS